MQWFYRFLMVLTGLALGTSVQAGPNAGGVFIAHVNEGLIYTEDNTGYCGQSGLELCSSADVRIDGTDPVIFFAIAAFPGNARLAGTTFGIQYNANEMKVLDWGMCGDFELPEANWPATGSGVAVTWNEAQTDRAIEVYWFAGYSYYENAHEFAITAHPVRGFEPYFADDDVPSNLDQAIDTGSLGFNTDGYLPCAAERSCTIALRPSQITAYQPCGGSFPVDLEVIDVEDLGAFSACVGYDGSELVFAGAVIDPTFLGSTGRTVIPAGPTACNPLCQLTGKLLRATTTGAPDGPSGSGRLGQIRLSFLGGASGENTICLGECILQNTGFPPEQMFVESAPGMAITYSSYCYGDYNGDSDVTVLDLAQIIPRWTRCSGDPGYDARFDVNLLEVGNYCASTADGCVDVVDVQTVAGRWHSGCGDGFARAESDASEVDHPLALPSVRISPAFRVLQSELGDTVSVSLVIDNAADLGAFEAELTFDPGVLQWSRLDPGNMLTSTGRTRYALATQVDNSAGVIRFGGCSVGTVPGAAGSGVLARIVFEIEDCDATTDLAISDVTVTDTAGTPQTLGGTTDGSIEIHCSSASAPSWPASGRELALSIVPNPLSRMTEIAFSIPAQAGDAVETKLEVFDASGRLVRGLLQDNLRSGPHSVRWDARDDAGNELPAGAFFCRLRVGELTVQEQMVLMR